jgi:glycosyltransferase (TIGR04182 family)
MSIQKDDVCILIPTLNEAPTIGDLIREFHTLGFNNILVIDGNSIDETPDIARSAGADVFLQTGRGKGNAIIEAFGRIKQPYILMLDGDGTYSPEDAERMLAPLTGGYDHVIGDRLTPQNKLAFSRLNFHGNQVLNKIFKVAHGRYLYDILSGYRAFRRDALSQMHLTESGFEIETEISVEAVRSRQQIAIVPIAYAKRPGTGTKLNPFHDGFKITTTIYRLARMNNPMFYFGLIGVIMIIGGLGIGIYVILEWLRHIEHLPLTLLTVLLIVVGFEIFMFGVISDMLLVYHREMIQELQMLEERIRPKP